MGRFILFIALSIFGFACYNTESKAANMTVVYVGASDCPSCRKYEANEEDAFGQLLKSKKIGYKTVMVASLRDLSQEAEYPKDLKFLPKAANLHEGTPHFVLLSGKEILVNASGFKHFKQLFLEQIE